VVLFARLDTSRLSLTELLMAIAFTSGHFVLLFGVIAFVLFALATYKQTIVQGHVSPSYTSFSNLVVILLMVQLYMVVQHLNKPMSRVTTSVMYLLGTLTGICAALMYIVLKYYSTDGFQCLQNQCVG